MIRGPQKSEPVGYNARISSFPDCYLVGREKKAPTQALYLSKARILHRIDFSRIVNHPSFTERTFPPRYEYGTRPPQKRDSAPTDPELLDHLRDGVTWKLKLFVRLSRGVIYARYSEEYGGE